MATTEDLASGPLDVLTPEEVQAEMQAGRILLIDVRTPMEYAWEHVAGALLLPMAGFDPGALPTDSARGIVFHCGSGIRSKIVAEKCLDAGWPRVTHMAGGMAGWKKAKLPYIAIDPGSGAPRRVGG